MSLWYGWLHVVAVFYAVDLSLDLSLKADICTAS